jgi:hypothetical protein
MNGHEYTKGYFLFQFSVCFSRKRYVRDIGDWKKYIEGVRIEEQKQAQILVL